MHPLHFQSAIRYSTLGSNLDSAAVDKNPTFPEKRKIYLQNATRGLNAQVRSVGGRGCAIVDVEGGSRRKALSTFKDDQRLVLLHFSRLQPSQSSCDLSPSLSVDV
jgi:hypothetical protein